MLLRLVNRTANEHAAINEQVRELTRLGVEAATTLQNLCEFWSTCTRPITARGGLGLSDKDTLRHLRTVERMVRVLPDSSRTKDVWLDLVLKHKVRGVQVHDTRLVAQMVVHRVGSILTFNEPDFRRFDPLIKVVQARSIATP